MLCKYAKEELYILKNKGIPPWPGVKKASCSVRYVA